MNKTNIEWCDYTINPVKGLCPVDCKDAQGKSYCYARRMYKRFGWDPEIRFEPWVLDDLFHMPSGSKVFVGSTIDLFYPGLEKYLNVVLHSCASFSHLTSIFLTKQPQNLAKWSPFPENCWVGTTLTGMEQDFYQRVKRLQEIQASVKFISFEPLLTCIGLPNRWPTDFLFADGVNWIIIGGLTPYSPKTAPRVAWIKEIIEAADKAGAAVFEKNNLNWLKYSAEGSAPFYRKEKGTWVLRQEYPEAKC